MVMYVTDSLELERNKLNFRLVDHFEFPGTVPAGRKN